MVQGGLLQLLKDNLEGHCVHSKGVFIYTYLTLKWGRVLCEEVTVEEWSELTIGMVALWSQIACKLNEFNSLAGFNQMCRYAIK